MAFEDYNYAMFNPYILVQKEIAITDKKDEYLDAYRLNAVKKEYDQTDIVGRTFLKPETSYQNS